MVRQGHPHFILKKSLLTKQLCPNYQVRGYTSFLVGLWNKLLNIKLLVDYCRLPLDVHLKTYCFYGRTQSEMTAIFNVRKDLETA